MQGFDYAKQHLGQQGGDEEALPVTQETMVLPLPIRDAPLSQERGMHQDGTTSKKTLSSEVRKRYGPLACGNRTWVGLVCISNSVPVLMAILYPWYAPGQKLAGFRFKQS